MSAMDEFVAVKKMRDQYALLAWCASPPRLRLFYPDDGSRTREAELTNGDAAIISEACSVVEHEGSADISYAASMNIGNAVKKEVLRYLDKKLAKLAVAARSQAEEVLSTLQKGLE